MSSRWGTIPFGDTYAVPSKNGLMAPSRTRGSGVSLVNMREIFAHDRIADPRMELAPLPERNRAAWLLKSGDLLFARQSLTLEGAGKCSIVLPSNFERTFESHIIRVRLNQDSALPNFYYYFFRSPQGRRLIESITEQVAASGIRSSDLATLKVPHPKVDEQWRIAEVLGALDDIIDTNERLTQSFSDLQHSLYSAAIETATSSIDFGKLADLVKVRAGESADMPYLGLEHFAEEGRGIASVGKLSDTVSQQYAFETGDVLYGRLRPYFRKVDRPGFSGACSGEVWVLKPREGIPSSFLHSVVASQGFTDFAMAGSGGTHMPRARWDHVASFQVSLPDGEKLAEFGAIAEAFWEQSVALKNEIEELRRTRDELLPLLMSGKVRVLPESGEEQSVQRGTV